MAVFHDMECTSCHSITYNLPLSSSGSRCTCGKGILEILWSSSTPHNAAAHSSERTILYYSEEERKYQYPGRTDRPVPSRLQQRGYRRVEFNSYHDLAKHERKHNVCAHNINYNRNGRSYDGGD